MLVVRERIFEATAAALRRATTDAGFPNLLAAPPAPASRQQPVPVGGAASAEAVEQLAGSCQAADLNYVPPERLAEAAAEAAAQGLAVMGSSHPPHGLQQQQQEQQQQLLRAEGDQRRSRQPSAARQRRNGGDPGAAAALALNGWCPVSVGAAAEGGTGAAGGCLVGFLADPSLGAIRQGVIC
jgi:hypothetical protein